MTERQTPLSKLHSAIGFEPYRNIRDVRDSGSKTEDRVFSQKVSEDERNNISAGFCGDSSGGCDFWAQDQHAHCIDSFKRNIYEGGFPNCAATVEDGSWCEDNDACYSSAVIYQDMKDCSKAWE